MGVGEHHLELVSHRHSRHHIADGAADGADGGVALLLLEPHPEPQGVLVGLGLALVDFDRDVPEGLREGAQLALHHYFSGLHLHLHALGDLEFLLG